LQDSSERAAAAQEDVTRLSLWATAGTGLLAALGAGYWFGWKAALGVALGSALGIANLAAITFIVRGFVRERRAGAWILLGMFKFGLMGFLLLAVLGSGLPWLALLVGYGSLPIGILASQLSAGRGRGPDARTLEG
jgi:hypothetical protein